MDKLKIRFDPSDNTLIVWFDDPSHMAYLSPVDEENTPGDVFLIKAEDGRVVGVECQFYHIEPGTLSVDIETAPLRTPSTSSE